MGSGIMAGKHYILKSKYYVLYSTLVYIPCEMLNNIIYLGIFSDEKQNKT